MEPASTGAPRARAALDAVAARLRRAGRARQALLVLLLYLAVAFLLYATPIATDLASRSIGVGKSDSKLYLWSLAWLPYALAHGLSPFETLRVFAPGGADLTWVTTLPAPAIVLWPVTALAGPLAAYNLLLLLAPALAGWATFLLCRRVTDRFWPSVAGGYLFAFSTYMVAQLHGHANLVLIWPAPFCAYLVVRRVAGDLGRVPFVAGVAGSLLFLFGSSTELFATTTLFGGLAFAGALALGGARLRRPTFEAGLLVAAAYAVVGIVVSPFLLRAFGNLPGAPIRPIDRASVDLLSFVVPRTSTLVGGARWAGVTARFTSSIVEDGGYLGGLVVVLALALWAGRRRRETWLLVGFVAVSALLSLGPILHVLGDEAGWLPGSLVARIPLLEHATPQRFTAYMAIAVSVVAARWLASPGRGLAFRWALVAVSALLLLPDLSSPPYHPALRVPRFVATGAWREVLAPDEVVYAIPAAHAEELVWQVESGQGFRLAQGYLGPIPVPYRGIPGSRGLALDHPSRRWPLPGDLARWFDVHGVRTVLVDELAQPQFRVLLDVAMGWEAERVEDVYVYRAGPDAILPGAAPRVPIARFVVGEPAPDATLAALDGGPVRLADLRGRPVVLSFLASWCVDGCRNQLEALRNVAREQPGIAVVAAMVSDAPEDARAFLARSGLSLAAAGLDPDGLLYLGTGSAIVPTTVVIAADGTVLRVLVDPLTPDLFPRSVAAIIAREG